MVDNSERPVVPVCQVAAGDVLAGDVVGLPGNPPPAIAVRHIGPLGKPIRVHHHGEVLHVIPVMLTWKPIDTDRCNDAEQSMAGRTWLTTRTRVTLFASGRR